MKKVLITLLLCAATSSCFAWGYQHGGYRRGGWVAPAVVGAVAGAVIYDAVRPAPVVVTQPVVVQQSVYAPPPPEPVHYYCPAYNEFYPYASSCPQAWVITR